MWTQVGRVRRTVSNMLADVLLTILVLLPAEMNQTSAGLPGSNYTYTEMELKDTTLLFIVAIVVCALVVFFCLLSVAIAICLVVHCVKLYKTSAALGDEDSRKKRGKEGAREPQDDSKGDNGMQLRALRAVTCSVESLTNGNYKQNPQYSKVEYLVSLQLIHADWRIRR